jgi:peptidoglycan/xylan/chitin deacetylase (PgdA/CDA1 family)
MTSRAVPKDDGSAAGTAPQAGASLVLFWDYDAQWGADRSRIPGEPKTWGPLEFENTERLLELHAEHDIPACFAVVGSVALPGERPYHDPAQVRRIHEAGHEVGSHSHRHEWLPGLNGKALRETLRSSKDALEQCIGRPVTSFVPPWNQPFDYPRRLSISLSERRQVRSGRTDLRRLCSTLAETGYRFCRVAYRPLHERLADRLGRREDPPRRPETIAGVVCLRLNGFGFAEDTSRVVERCIASGGVAVVYAHPHSIRLGGPQDESHLVPFLRSVCEHRQAGRLRLCLPRDIDTEM